ncbi:MAG: GNAT family N-acetyltransferase, partial [Pseudomonadota bacterium]
AQGWRETDKPGRRAMFEARIAEGPPPGVLAYRGDAAVGWAQCSPRAEVPRYNAARMAKPVPGADLEKTWALICFFIRKDARGEGLMTALAEAACRLAADHGAQAVEAAPLEPRRELQWGEGYVGVASALARAGFEVVERRSDLRPFMRWTP